MARDGRPSPELPEPRFPPDTMTRNSETTPPDATAAGQAGFRSGFVALSGRPNVGKSTLLNRLVGSKVSIVSPVAQTTRMIVRAVARTKDSEVIYLDTPGVHKPQFRMNREMVRLARAALAEVDLVGLMVEGPEGFGPGDAYMLRLLQEAKTPAYLIINKIDVLGRSALLPLMALAAKRHPWEEIFPVSALTGEGCNELAAAIRRRIPEGGPLFPEDYLSDLPERLALGELIREQVL